MPRLQLLNVKIINTTIVELLNELNEGVVFTPNIDHFIKLQKNRELYDCYKNADWIICDSKVIYALTKIIQIPLKATICGSDLFPAFYKYHAKNKKMKIFLLGSKKEIVDKAIERINKNVGRSIIVGGYSPEFVQDVCQLNLIDISRSINQSNANVVVVGLGCPKQEIFINRYKSLMPNVKIWMGLGATIDFEAGVIKRAPKWMRLIAMEWFYRFLLEPRRMFKRYFIDDLPFFIFFAKQMIGTYKNPFEE